MTIRPRRLKDGETVRERKEGAEWRAFLEELSETSEHQVDFSVGVYKRVFPDWDEIDMIEGHPKTGKELGLLIWDHAIAFDKTHHPGVVTGGLWLNKGFGTDDKLGPFEIGMEGVRVFYREGENEGH